MRPTRLNCWKIMAQRARQWRNSRPRRTPVSAPFQMIRPALGSISRLIMRSSVDLPAPEGPITPTNWPFGISRDTPSTARLRPKSRVKPSSTNMLRRTITLERAAGCQRGVTA